MPKNQNKDIERSYEPINESDLKKLRQLALNDFRAMITKNPHLKVLEKLKLGIAFCQGAALHFAINKLGLPYKKIEDEVVSTLNKKLGVKDFDVFMFFKKGTKEYPPRRRAIDDFGEYDRFGKHPDEKTKKAQNFTGRRVDLMGRSIPYIKGQSFEETLQTYLSDSSTATARELSNKAVVILEPKQSCGKIVWMRNQPFTDELPKTVSNSDNDSIASRVKRSRRVY